MLSLIFPQTFPTCPRNVAEQPAGFLRPCQLTIRTYHCIPSCLLFLLLLPLLLFFVIFPHEVHADSFTLTVLHTNDVHSRFEQFTSRDGRCTPRDVIDRACYGGVARRATIVREMRERFENVVLLDAGDQFQGSPWFNVYKGRAASYFMDLLRYDVMTLGNHEFDNGVDGLLPFLHNVTFPVVCANIITDNEPKFTKDLVKKYHILNVGGRRIGVIGYITEDVPQLSVTGKLRFLDPVSPVQQAVNELRGQGVNIIIALGHAGIKVDRQLAETVDGLDLVVGGHTNTFLFTGEPSSNEIPEGPYPLVVERRSGSNASRYEQVLVVQDYAYGKYMGFLRVVFDERGRVQNYSGNPILLDYTVEEDVETLKKLVEWRSGVERLYGTVLGQTKVYLNGQATVCRLEECNLGDLIADWILDYFVTVRTLDVQVALVNGGSIRASIEPGNVTYEDILKVMPFGNTVDVIELLGSDLLKVLEFSVYDYDTATRNGKFLQMSGIRVQYDLSRPNDRRVVYAAVANSQRSSSQVISALPNQGRPDIMYEPVDMSRLYKVAMPSFMTRGGDGYAMIPVLRKNFFNFGIVDVEIFTQLMIRHSPVVTEVDGRITFINSSSFHHPISSNDDIISSGQRSVHFDNVTNARLKFTVLILLIGLILLR